MLYDAFKRFFDIMNKQYIDIVIQNLHDLNKTDAAVTMLERLPENFPTILIADRNYENYNLFAHTEERLFDYVVRLRTGKSTCMFSGIGLPENTEFDITKEVVITRNSTGPHHVNPRKYKYLTKGARFDFILDKLKELYHLRWGIETSFRDLKHVIGMTCFHTKK